LTALRYAASRAAGALVAIFAATTMNFLLFRLAPGDAASVANVPNASPALQRALRREFGLDRPLLSQYGHYLDQLLHGNLGVSFASRVPVSHILRTAVGNTVPMALLGTVIAVALAFGGGIVAAWLRGTAADHALRGTALAFYALPAQWLGIMLIFAFQRWLPAGGISDPFLIDPSPLAHYTDELRHMILPSLTYALTSYGAYLVVLRTSLIGALSEEYVLTALAKGLPRRTVVRRHALRNSLLPVTNLIGLTLGTLIGGVILIETVFSWPGIGETVYRAVTARDYPVLQGAFLLLTVSVIVCNLLADIVCRILDPRIGASA
jgi:peptide/nickel transport system permease protein